jgi:hypothetical protein
VNIFSSETREKFANAKRKNKINSFVIVMSLRVPRLKRGEGWAWLTNKPLRQQKMLLPKFRKLRIAAKALQLE